MDLQQGFNDIDPPLCANGCGLFGTSATQNLCSKCYKEFLKEEEESVKAKAKSMQKATGPMTVPTSSSNDITTSMAQLSLPSENTEKTINNGSFPKMVERCEKCKKKVGMIGFKRRCESTFCAKHRLPEKHECSFDYKTMGREILMRQNPLIKPD